MYADDLLLMSSSILELQKIVYIWKQFLGINFNYKNRIVLL